MSFRECASDPTCVFCQDCFQNSEHKYHKYRVCCMNSYIKKIRTVFKFFYFYSLILKIQ